VSRPRTPSFGAQQRSRRARRAATARWARLGRGVLTLAQIRDAVTKALADRKAKAYLFESYARGDATARDEIYILVIVEKMPEDWAKETAVWRPGATLNAVQGLPRPRRRGHLRHLAGPALHVSTAAQLVPAQLRGGAHDRHHHAHRHLQQRRGSHPQDPGGAPDPAATPPQICTTTTSGVVLTLTGLAAAL